MSTIAESLIYNIVQAKEQDTLPMYFVIMQSYTGEEIKALSDQEDPIAQKAMKDFEESIDSDSVILIMYEGSKESPFNPDKVVAMLNPYLSDIGISQDIGEREITMEFSCRPISCTDVDFNTMRAYNYMKNSLKDMLEL